MNRENAPVHTANNCYTHRRPPSPTQQQQQPSPLTQISPSTARPSPQQTPGPLDASSAAESSGRRGMRSQIACARCRRSKTKCENLGVDTTCKACANAKRDCVWDHTAVPSSTGSLRRDSTADFDVSTVSLNTLLVVISCYGFLLLPFNTVPVVSSLTCNMC
jgi:hypothetical protein